MLTEEARISNNHKSTVPASLNTELLMPYGIRKVDGKEVSVEEVPRGIAAGCVCICCAEPIMSKQGKVRRWHFSHVPSGGVNCDRDQVIHTSAILAIKKGIEHAIEVGGSYPLRWRCVHCDAVTPEELARSDTIVIKERTSVEQTRSDLIVRWGNEQRIIEVVFTHEPSQPTHERYRQSGVPVILVRVGGMDDVEPLKAALDAHEGINYPKTACGECERRGKAEAEWNERRKRTEAEQDERRRKAKAERDERAAVWAKWRESIREADGKMRKAIRAFLQPPDGPMPVHKYWRDGRMRSIPPLLLQKIHREQRKLIRLGFSQHNGDKLWLMRKKFTDGEGEELWAYVDYFYYHRAYSIRFDVYHFPRPSVWNRHADHFDYFLEIELRQQGLEMEGLEGDATVGCRDCQDIEHWVESGQYENSQWIEEARRLLRPL